MNCIVTENDGTQHYSQDHEDGAALRRLREALAPGEEFTVALVKGMAGERFVCQMGTFMTMVHEEMGSTIAEAADKCREALG